MPTITLVLKSARNPAMNLSIPSVDPATTTIQTLKEQIQSHLGGPSVVALDKIKILLNKKPVPPSKKTIVDALDGSGKLTEKELEFGVMVMGGAPDPPPQRPVTVDEQIATAPRSAKAVAGGESTAMEGVESTTTAKDASIAVQPGELTGSAVLETAEFWDDLQGFLEQRIRDRAEAVKLREIVERSWRSKGSNP